MEQKYLWDLTGMFPDDAAWAQQLSEVVRLGDELAALRGKTTASAKTLLHTLQLTADLNCRASQVSVYAECRYHTDMSSEQGKSMIGSLQAKLTEIGEKTSFLEPEWMKYDLKDFERACEEEPGLRMYTLLATDLFEKKQHVLDDRGEAMLTRIGDLGENYCQIFEDLVINDTETPSVQGPDGRPVPVTEAGYNRALLDPDRAFRARYFNALLGRYQKCIHTLSSCYAGRVKADVYLARSRNYASARKEALADNHIPETVYDSLISTVQSRTQPLCEYIALRKKILGIDDFHFYDFFVPLSAAGERKYTFEEAADLAVRATSVLGADYTARIRKAVSSRWIDVFPKSNKQTGAYSTGTYGFHPYMLLNFGETLEDVFTLVHELGHSLHTMASCEAQPFIYSDYSIFCAEVASTVNEQLLYHYLLDHADSDDLKRMLLAKHLDDIRSTFYRQVMFADFEKQTHALAEEGSPLLPGILCGIHRKLNEEYYGPSLVTDDLLSCEWARIPHYYHAFYVYQYATGISAAISISRRILSGQPGAVEGYLSFLTGGSSAHPIDLLKRAGVDMSSPQPVEATADEFASTLEELKKLF